MRRATHAAPVLRECRAQVARLLEQGSPVGKAFAELDWDVLRLAKTKAESAAKEESFARARKSFARPAAGAARFTWVF